MGTYSSPIPARDYTWVPKQDMYKIFQKEERGDKMVEIPITIRFVDEETWERVIKEHYPKYTPEQVGGMEIDWERKDNGQIDFKEIYIPRQKDGSIILRTFGHEMAHILDGKWHN